MWPPRSFAGGYDSEQAKISNLKINHTPTRRANSSPVSTDRNDKGFTPRVSTAADRSPHATRLRVFSLDTAALFGSVRIEVLEARPLPLPPRLPQRGKVKRWVKSLRRSSAAHSASRSLLPLLPSSLRCEGRCSALPADDDHRSAIITNTTTRPGQCMWCCVSSERN